MAAPVLQKAKSGLEIWFGDDRAGGVELGNRHFPSYLGSYLGRSDLLLLLLNMNELIPCTSDTDHMVLLVNIADVPLLLCFALLHKFSLFSFYPVCSGL